MYLSFANSFRESQMKSLVQAITKFQETGFKKSSPVFSSEISMHNFSLYKNNKDNQLVDLSTHPAAREIAVISEFSLKPKTEKNSSVLVGLGPSVEFQNGFIVSQPERLNILRTMADLLEHLIKIQQNQINLTLLNDSFSTLGQEFLNYLNIALTRARVVHGIKDFSFTRFPAGDLLGHLETMSGLSATTEDPHRPFVRLSLKRLTDFCKISGLPAETAVEYKTQIECFQKLRYFYAQVEKNQAALNQADLSTNFQETLNTINGLLQTNQNQVEFLPVLKSQSVGLNLKSYFHPIPILEMNAVFSSNLRNNELCLGLGKAYFRSFSQFENVGLLTGLDAGFTMNFRTKLFQGGKISGFVGLGISF